jgi:hypothetical protein
MNIEIGTLHYLLKTFKEIIKELDGMDFVSFDTDSSLKKEEDYKFDIYENARDIIKYADWKEKDIGTGKIHETIVKTINVKSNNLEGNNLVNYWIVKDNFKKIKPTVEFEKTLYKFYKSKDYEYKILFNNLYSLGLTYNLIAFLFFIKEKNQFLPISQKRFDEIFEEIEINFKTNETTWENYESFLNIIKQVKEYLKKNLDNKTELLHAHSFLWFTGNRLLKKNEK